MLSLWLASCEVDDLPARTLGLRARGRGRAFCLTRGPLRGLPTLSGPCCKGVLLAKRASGRGRSVAAGAAYRRCEMRMARRRRETSFALAWSMFANIRFMAWPPQKRVACALAHGCSLHVCPLAPCLSVPCIIGRIAITRPGIRLFAANRNMQDTFVREGRGGPRGAQGAGQRAEVPSGLRFLSGAPCGPRTHDLGIKSPLLYQLS